MGGYCSCVDRRSEDDSHELEYIEERASDIGLSRLSVFDLFDAVSAKKLRPKLTKEDF